VINDGLLARIDALLKSLESHKAEAESKMDRFQLSAEIRDIDHPSIEYTYGPLTIHKAAALLF
jgi:hypothetical protein